METLKNYQLHLFSFIVLNAMVIGVDSYFATEIKKLDAVTIKNLVLIPSISILLSIVFNGILTSNIKYRIVFLKWANPLPASRLQKIIKDDPRFNIEQVIEKYGPIPSDPKQQNIYWYQKLYKNHQDVEKVRDIHRLFLMTRDMTAISFLVLIVSILNVLFFNGTMIQILIVLVEYLLLRQVCCNYGNRFVATVVAESI
jgi:hypothetical protein